MKLPDNLKTDRILIWELEQKLNDMNADIKQLEGTVKKLQKTISKTCKHEHVNYNNGTCDDCDTFSSSWCDLKVIFTEPEPRMLKY